LPITSASNAGSRHSDFVLRKSSIGLTGAMPPLSAVTMFMSPARSNMARERILQRGDMAGGRPVFSIADLAVPNMTHGLARDRPAQTAPILLAMALRTGQAERPAPHDEGVFPADRDLIPAGQKIDSLVDGRAAGISLISRAAATPTLRADQSALPPIGITALPVIHSLPARMAGAHGFPISAMHQAFGISRSTANTGFIEAGLGGFGRPARTSLSLAGLDRVVGLGSVPATALTSGPTTGVAPLLPASALDRAETDLVHSTRMAESDRLPILGAEQADQPLAISVAPASAGDVISRAQHPSVPMPLHYPGTPRRVDPPAVHWHGTAPSGATAIDRTASPLVAAFPDPVAPDRFGANAAAMRGQMAGPQTGSPQSASPEQDTDELTEQVWRAVMSRLSIEQERRGFGRWA
jgi:hypothetical protein